VQVASDTSVAAVVACEAEVSAVSAAAAALAPLDPAFSVEGGTALASQEGGAAGLTPDLAAFLASGQAGGDPAWQPTRAGDQLAAQLTPALASAAAITPFSMVGAAGQLASFGQQQWIPVPGLAADQPPQVSDANKRRRR
jgi:hypothetical protein